MYFLFIDVLKSSVRLKKPEAAHLAVLDLLYSKILTLRELIAH